MSFLSSFYPQPVVAGTTEGTYAEGNDSRIVGALPSSTAGSGSVLASGSNTSRTLSNRFADVVNVKDFGAVGDAKKLTGGSITAGSNVLTCSTASFTSADVGKSISLGYAGTNGHTLYTTISAVNSATEIELAANAITTTSVSEILYGTEDGPEIRSAITYARSVNKPVYLPRGQYLMNTALSTASGNPQISSIPVGGGGLGIWLVNNDGTKAQSFYMIGDGASIVSSLYPPQSGDNNGFVFVLFQGFFDEIHFEGITFDSSRQMALSTSGTGAVGRVYGFLISGVGGVSGFWSQENRPFNFKIHNCNFYDQTLSIRVDNAENLSVSGCNFFYRRGQAGVGNGDWTGAMGIRQVRVLRVVNNYMNGCLIDDMDSVTTTFEDHRCVDNFVITGANGGEHKPEMFLISDNVITRFGKEAIQISADPQGSFDNNITDGCCIVNNWFDGRYPENHKPETNYAIRVHDAHSTIVGNNVFQASVGILLTGNYARVEGVTAHHTLVDSNNIILCSKSRSGFRGATGISFEGDNIVVQNNQITGHDVGSYRQNGWTGTGTRPTATVASSSAANNTITVTGNVWPDGSTITFSNLPANSGLTAGPVFYYVVNRNGDTFQVSTSENGSAVDILVDITGANIFADRLEITSAISFGGTSIAPSYSPEPPLPTGKIVNNNLKIISKNSPSDVCAAFLIDNQSGTAFVENNTIDGFDFLVHRGGGNNLNYIFENNKIKRYSRMVSGYATSSYGAPIIKNQLFSIYPTQTGWYQVPFYSENRYGIHFNYAISTNPENRYGDTTSITQNGSQSTRLSVSNYDESGLTAGGTNSRLVITQNHAGQYPAITKAYIRNSFGGILFYVYVDKVLTKAALTFSGGGGSGAAGYANISGGVVQSVTMTNNGGVANGGTDYTSAPTVSISNTVIRNIKGSGATFTAVLSGNTVGSVTVGGSGGSGYSQPIYFNFECKNTEYNGIALDAPVYTATTPSNGMEVPFSAGFKSMTLSGGSGGTITGTGTPTIATTAPASTPEFIGQQYIDTSTGIAYLAAGTASSSDWKAISFWEP